MADWAVNDQVFAGRITPRHGQLEIPAGARGFLFLDGRYEGPVGPGRHKVPRSAQVVMARAGEMEVELTASDLFTADPLPLQAKSRAAIVIDNEELFLQNLMLDRAELTRDDLAEISSAAVRPALEQALAQRTADSLIADAAFCSEAAGPARRLLDSSLQRFGLAAARFEVLEISHPALQNLQDQNGELALLEKEVDQSQRRVELWSKMLKAANSMELEESRSKGEMAAFLAEIDKEKLLRDEEVADLERSLADKREDHRLARTHLIKRLELEQEAERSKLDLLHRLEREKLQTAHGIQQELERHRAAHEMRIEKSKAGLEILNQMKAAKAERQRESESFSLEQMKERLAAFSQAAAEALIAVSEPEKAEHLRKLEEMRIKSGMTKDQLIGLAAETSPETAAIIKELYERLLTRKDEENWD